MTGLQTPRSNATRRLAGALLLVAAPFVLFCAGRGLVEFTGDLLQQRYPPPGRMISAGDHRLDLYCIGIGRPAIIIEPGMAAAWSDWHPVVSRLRATGQVCVYDRAGYGWSQSGPMPRDATVEAKDLHILLSNAGIEPPYILIGHSYGGYIARIYAGLFGDSLAGVVLADPAIEGEPLSVVPLFRKIVAFFPPVGAQRLVHLIEGRSAIPPDLSDAPAPFQARFLIGPSVQQQEAERSELVSLPQTEAAVRHARFPEDLALTVITARHLISPRQYYPPPVPEPPPSHQAFHERLSRQSVRGRYIVAERSGHQIEMDQPELIAGAVQDMIHEFRSR